MANAKRKKVREEDITGLKYFDRLEGKNGSELFVVAHDLSRSAAGPNRAIHIEFLSQTPDPEVK